jgi:S1-C subfamily serine protease
VIPWATVDRVVPGLLENGRVARGWLGVALRPVALPEPLQRDAGQTTGLMVMSLAEQGPAAKAGVIAGDILVGVDGAPAQRFRRIARQLGSESVGRTVDLRLVRAGAVLSVKTTVEARPAE